VTEEIHERRGRVMIEGITATSMKTNNPMTIEVSILFSKFQFVSRLLEWSL